MAALSSLSKFKHTGLLLMRIGVGLLFITHGYPKLMGGPAMWEAIGGAMGHVGITAFPAVWGFLAGLTETLGGLLIVIGFCFRPVTILLTFVMLLASFQHLGAGDGLSGAAHAMKMGFVFLGLTFIGPGRYSVDKR